MDQPYVLRSDDGGVTTLTLNRGERFNPLSEEMLGELHAALKGIAQDYAVRVVVLAAAGKAFCAGHDLKQMMQTPDADYYKKLFQQCSKLMLLIQQM
ncbi:MAG: enoyl-CoA hydratase-related protein, partial [Pseudomonadota bacterium]